MKINSSKQRIDAIMLYLLFLWISYSSNLNAQTHLNLGYYDFDIASRNIVLGISKVFKKHHVLGIGLKYHLNDPIRSDFSNGATYRTLSADKWYEHLGFLLEYKHQLPCKTALLEPFLFYNLQNTYGVKKTDRVYDFSRRKWWDSTFVVREMYLFENQFGVGLDIPIAEKISLSLRAGVGFVFYWHFNEPFIEKKFLNVTSTNRDFDRMFSASIQYELIPPKKRKVKQ